MSTTSLFTGLLPEVATSDVKPTKMGGGIWARFIAGISKAREAQAKREINRFLARQPERMLRDIGLNDI